MIRAKSKLPRNALFGLLTFCLALFVLEFGAFAMLSLGKREIVTWSTFAAWRADAGAPTEEAWRNEDRAASIRAKTNQTIHPFLGFVADADLHPAAQDPAMSPQAIEHGFPRNRHDLFYEPDDKRFVVAVFGGSVAGNLTAFKPHPLEKALARLPALADREIKILSLATGGYKQPQQLMTLNWFLALGAHFDLVINLDGFNEIALPPANHLPNGVFPLFPLDWQLRAGNLDPKARREIARLALLRERRTTWASSFNGLPWRYSLVAATLWKVGDRLVARQIMAALDEVQQRKQANSFHVRGPRQEVDDSEAVMRQLVDVWFKASVQMHELCQALGIRYFHFIQPNQYLAGSKTLSDEERRLAFRKDHPYRKGVIHGYPLLIERGKALKAHGIAFHDLTRIFARRKDTLYADTCCHLNKEGRVLLARAIAKRIEQDL